MTRVGFEVGGIRQGCFSVTCSYFSPHLSSSSRLELNYFTTLRPKMRLDFRRPDRAYFSIGLLSKHPSSSAHTPSVSPHIIAVFAQPSVSAVFSSAPCAWRIHRHTIISLPLCPMVHTLWVKHAKGSKTPSLAT